MAATWMSVVVMLWVVADVYSVRSESDGQPCASVHANSSVVAMGSPVEATCVITNDCPLLTGHTGDVEWRLDDMVLPSVPTVNRSNRTYRVVIPSFQRTRAILTCCILTSPMQIIGGVEIRAGYPPSVPQNLSCQTNLSTHRSLTCNWKASLEATHLPTKYTLHTHIGSLNQNHTYELPPGVQSYTIPRTGFVLFSEMEIYVKAVNQLGEASSPPLTLEPISSAKFDPPKIVKIQVVQFGCLRLRWDLSQHQHWMKDYVSLEVRVKTAASSQWNQPPILVPRVVSKKPVDRCHLLHGMQYVAQIRVQYQQSPWSEWSNSQSAMTMERAPTGLLDTWMRVTRDHMHKQLQMLLFWKPSQRFRANGRNVSYVVSVQKVVSKKGTLCATAERHCTFQVPQRARKVYVIAVNAAGKSSPTQVRIYHPKAHEAILDVSAVALDNRSLLVQWKKITSAILVDHVVEWRPLLQNDLSLVQFELAGQNMSSIVITGSFEPYKPYGISVYPRFKDGIGRPQTVNAYSLQKAPSLVPHVTIQVNGQSHVELTWNEIPLDQRNGIIRSYKLFYWDETRRVHVAIGDLEERRLVLTGLNALYVYDAVLMVSTDGGSRNGSMVHFDVKGIDRVAVVLMVVLPGVVLALLFIFMVVACYTKESRLKVRFWPNVPDPANSSIKSWTSESTQDVISPWDREEPNPVYLSHLSFLELPMKQNKEDDDSSWSNRQDDTSDLGESICGSPFLPTFSSSNSDSVPYATVIFPTPNSPPQQHAHVYLRSESTQPLLASEELQSPKRYQNLVCDGSHGEQCFFGPCGCPEEEEEAEPAIHWDDFPFLSSLAMNETH
uniref:granulocyte colony-stimulating factor receptor n=1 Tax=Doryrhamphus excisus TaxID=161450 RepID=UPI0025ADF09F|nr:granulocyte colony-stimulating factor receptor [Doryrhamphus excisus]XP_057909245.1 granulocyte colony-stimulating factor receptor [Doryrhamphus excisus]